MVRRFICFALIAIVVAGMPSPAVARDATAVVVDGDTLTRIVTTTDPDAPLMAAGLAGLYRLDATAWVRIAGTVPAGEIVSDGATDGMLLAGETFSCMKGGPPIELQRSHDGGATWAVVDGATGLRPLAMWPESGLALGATCAGVQRSTDLGLTWTDVPGIDPGWDVTAFADVTTDNGPVVLVGLTGEGGTTFLHRIDFTDPANPVVTASLREYYGIGGLAGSGDSWIQTAMDGTWLTADAGATWERLPDGLEGKFLDRDPLEFGLPQDLDPRQIGIYSAALIPGTSDGFVVGSANGVYVKPAGDMSWTMIEGTSGKVDQVVVSADGVILYRVDDLVMTAVLP